MEMLSVLVIDDDLSQLELLRIFCESLEYPRIEFHTADCGQAAIEILNKKIIDLVITDFRLPDINGLEVLKFTKSLNPEIRVVVMTAYQDTLQAVEILKTGADDYLIKPTSETDIKRLLLLSFERLSFRRETQALKNEIQEVFRTAPSSLKAG